MKLARTSCASVHWTQRAKTQTQVPSKQHFSGIVFGLRANCKERPWLEALVSRERP